MEADGGTTAQGELGMTSTNWSSELSAESRQRIVDRIVETLIKHLSMPVPSPEGFVELKRIAERFEEKVYATATSQADYLRKISLKMIVMETKAASNSGTGSENPQDPAWQSMLQLENQGQPLPFFVPQQHRQQPQDQKRSRSQIMGKGKGKGKRSRMSLNIEEGILCSICLDPVMDNGDRSTAKLQCGHQFHLDCIGSAFNAKGSMQCPTCRRVEKGHWLFADKHNAFTNFSEDD